jgi:hypothetical protein
LNENEKQRIYREVIEKLTEPFPDGTVEFRDEKRNTAFIPVQPYIKRLEDAAGVYWSWKLTGEPLIRYEDDLVEVRGLLKIVDAEREGIGFANLQRYSDTNKIRNLKDAIRAASSDAIRDACDKFRMGWKELAPYRKWSENPGTGLQKYLGKKSDVANKSNEECVVCRQPLSEEDKQQLAQYNVKIAYCSSHIPSHFKRGKS